MGSSEPCEGSSVNLLLELLFLFPLPLRVSGPGLSFHPRRIGSERVSDLPQVTQEIENSSRRTVKPPDSGLVLFLMPVIRAVWLAGSWHWAKGPGVSAKKASLPSGCFCLKSGFYFSLLVISISEAFWSVFLFS